MDTIEMTGTELVLLLAQQLRGETVLAVRDDGKLCAAWECHNGYGDSIPEALTFMLIQVLRGALTLSDAQVQEPAPKPHPIDIASKLPGSVNIRHRDDRSGTRDYSATWSVGQEPRAEGTGLTAADALRDLLSIHAVKAALPKDS